MKARKAYRQKQIESEQLSDIREIEEFGRPVPKSLKKIPVLKAQEKTK